MKHLCLIPLALIFSVGCVAIADSHQKPPVSNYTAEAPKDRVFTAAATTAGNMGRVIIADKETGIIQTQKGNWVVNAAIAPQSPTATKVSVSARFIPSNQLDFNSRDGLTAEFVSGLESALKSPLKPLSE